MKTYVLDASALFIFLQKKASAPKLLELFGEALRSRAEILMSAVNFGEVYGLILRRYGAERTNATVSAVFPLPIQMIDATPQTAMRAADIKVRYKLYYGDSFAASLAMDRKATLVTSDSDFKVLGSAASVLWLKN